MRNRCDSQLHDIETKLDDFKDQLDADAIKQIKEDAAQVSSTKTVTMGSHFVVQLKEEMASEDADPEELRTKYDDIQKRSMDMFGEAYKKKVSLQSTVETIC